ncbi:hypothetical protein BBW65_01495 [Helicobacter enhydrae]|uniref:Molybdopterin molybdenumtransferase n=1 Tax=Helicobacter enhydrae TaxID=222136 RepID=A0A1B1U492_9HELI|nr:molybdopterin molybdotransferase MoeA [Helicobacter enhydrae]ANV97561.1 hypothetical protein BBW65_01495 [Helicobacter enhydrae]
MKTNISYEESVEILRELKLEPLGIEKVFFAQSLNRVLAEDIVAQEDMPTHLTSAMDGYALKFEYLEILKHQGLVVGGICKAGESAYISCKQGECIKTFTGAKMPQGTDTLVLVEDVREEGGKIFHSMPQAIHKGQWVRQVGENYRQGEVLLKKGTKITPFEIGLLAELNRVFVCVYIAPKIAILSGGDEVIEVGEAKRENTIYSVNHHLLKAIAQNWGAEVFLFPLLQDDKNHNLESVRQALKQCDILVTTGGASKGDFDITQDVIRQECDMVFKGVRMKPGKPVGFGIKNQQCVFLLPGFPNSCAMTFMLFVRIAFAKLTGNVTGLPMPLKARLQGGIVRKDTRKEFRVCNYEIVDGEYRVGFWDKKVLQSSVVNNFCNQSGLLVLPEGGGDVPDAQMVDFYPLQSLLNL